MELWDPLYQSKINVQALRLSGALLLYFRNQENIEVGLSGEEIIDDMIANIDYYTYRTDLLLNTTKH